MLQIFNIIIGIYYSKFSKLQKNIYIINLINIIFIYFFSFYKIVFFIKHKYSVFYYINYLSLINDIFLLVTFNNIKIKLLINEKIYIFLNNQIINKIKINIYFIFIINTLISILIIIFYYYSIFNIIILENYIPKFINVYILFFLIFYSLNIKTIIFIYFINIINYFIQTFTDFLNLTKNNNLIFELISQYLQIRHYYNKNVNKFNNIISSFILFNYLPIFITINNISADYIDIFNYINLCYFILFIIILQYIFNKLDDNLKKLTSISDNNINIKKYIIRKPNLYEMQLNNENDINELSSKNFIIDIENSESLDWLILSNVLNQKLATFDIIGIEISSSNLITRIITLTIIIIFSSRIKL